MAINAEKGNVPPLPGGLYATIAQYVGGTFDGKNEHDIQFSLATQKLLKEAFAPFGEDDVLIDYHTHVMGLGVGGTCCCISKEFFEGSPKKKLTGRVYMSAGGVGDLANADRDYVDRLNDLTCQFPHRMVNVTLAFDKHYNEQGEYVEDRTEFYTPNEYIWSLFEEFPNFSPTVSVHPYRKDALEELEHWAAMGVRQIKWLPNAMGMDPASPLCDPFYAKVKELDMYLLCHCGDEKAVEGEEFQALGNPMRLARALDIGVKVIVAHCASLGCNERKNYRGGKEGEEEQGEDESAPVVKENFDMFLEMMGEPKWEGVLFGDISAVVLNNRSHYIRRILERPEIHHRLVNGSDYPLPAVSILVSTWLLYYRGLITYEERLSLNEIYSANPLLFDFVLKRCLKGPSGEKFPKETFLTNPFLPVFRK